MNAMYRINVRKKGEEEWKEAKITLEIDMEKLAFRLGARAVNNKNGVAKFIHGLIVVREVRK